MCGIGGFSCRTVLEENVRPDEGRKTLYNINGREGKDY